MKTKLRIIRILSLVALLLSIYITWTLYRPGAVLAGCGEGSGCETVLQTKWSSWLGFPVSAAGLVIYGSIFALSFVVSPDKFKGWLPLVFLSLLASGSGLWFMALQAFLIHSYCTYCSIIHLCGITIAILVWKSVPVMKPPTGKKKKPEPFGIPSSRIVQAAVLGILGVGVLAAGQMIKSDAIPQLVQPAKGNSSVSSVPVRTVSLLNGALSVPAGRFPILGSPDAERVVAHIFDYTCPACRQLHSDMLATHQTQQENVALAMIPMPLDAECNPGVSQTSYLHLNACTFARLGLAVWRTKPESYAAFDHFMFQSPQPPSAEQARAVADQLAGSQNIETAMNDPELADLLRAGINLFYSAPVQRKVLPILITPERAIFGVPDPPELTAIFVKN